MMLGVGVTSVAAQLMMTWALRDLPAATAGVLFQLAPVSTIVLGRILYDERPAGWPSPAPPSRSAASSGARISRRRRSACSRFRPKSPDATFLDLRR